MDQQNNRQDRPDDVKRCPVDGVVMDPNRAWWWTEQGAVCSETCARTITAPA